jgi:hypothetical protein
VTPDLDAQTAGNDAFNSRTAAAVVTMARNGDGSDVRSSSRFSPTLARGSVGSTWDGFLLRKLLAPS